MTPTPAASDTPVVALYGATALGKTEVALELAERLGADIVVADSMQVYRGLPIVTNQPDASQRARARHHLVGFVSPHEEYTVAEYARRAHEVIDGLLAQGRPVIVEGGSGLYLRATLGGLEFGAPPDGALRSALEESWARDPQGLLDELRRGDPVALARLDVRNPRRVVRAVEALRAGQRAPAAAGGRLWAAGDRYRHRLLALVPDDDRSALKGRIEARVDAMLALGALEEVERVKEEGELSATVRQAIGVRELLAVLDGSLALPDAGASMKTRTRALARRQLTWMRKLPEAALVAAGRSPAATADHILRLLREPA